MRGVFLLLFLALCTSGAQALDVSGTYRGELATEQRSQAISLNFSHKLSWLTARLGCDLEVTDGELSFNPRWEWQVSAGRFLQLTLSRNLAHHTSGDLFRLIDKDNFGPNTVYLGLGAQQVHWGWLKSAVDRNQEEVDAWFCESSLELGPLSLRGSGLELCGPKGAGSALALEACLTAKAWSWRGAWGRIEAAGVSSLGKVFVVERQGSLWQGKLTWQQIDRDFACPLAKTNKYPADRQGWHLEVTTEHNDLQLGLNLRRHCNLARTKTYNQLSFKLANAASGSSLEWRLEPTPALILQQVGADLQVKVDALNKTLRLDGTTQKLQWGLRFDVARLIGRVELRFSWGPEWRLIGKYDFQHNRTHASLLACLEGKTSSLKLELGKYDRGNMTAGFNNPPRFSISWAWEF